MDLLTVVRIIFLLSLGINLLSPSKVCGILAGVTSIVLGVFVLLGRF